MSISPQVTFIISSSGPFVPACVPAPVPAVLDKNKRGHAHGHACGHEWAFGEIMKISILSILCFYILCLFSLPHPLFAAETPTFQSPCTSIARVDLPNGMKVFLMSTDFDTDEVFIKLTAHGGYASLPVAERFSGEVAALIAWESGVGGMSSDQLPAFLYGHSLDLSLKIEPLSRIIEGSSSRKGLPYFLKIINWFFTQQSFTEAGWKSAQAIAHHSLEKLANDYDHLYETELLKVNTQDLDFLKPMTPADLSKVNFEAAKQFFAHSFSNPAEFVCVIVGSFKLQEAKASVAEILGTIPPSRPGLNQGFNYIRNPSTTFPPGITEKVVTLQGRPDSITRLTFPLKSAVNETNLNLVTFSSQIIEARLRRVITEKMKQSHGIDVSYEFPLYPRLDNAWISIRFRSDVKDITDIKQLILCQLNQLIAEGPSDAEVEHIRRLELGNDEFWMKDNSYWAATITNYILWGWPPAAICADLGRSQRLQAKDIRTFLSDEITTKNYSVVIGHP